MGTSSAEFLVEFIHNSTYTNTIYKNCGVLYILKLVWRVSDCLDAICD